MTFSVFTCKQCVQATHVLYDAQYKILAEERIFGECRFVTYVDRLFKIYIAVSKHDLFFFFV